MSTLLKNIQRKRRLAKRNRVHPMVSNWDKIAKVFPGNSALDVEMRAWIEDRKVERRLERVEASVQRRRGNRPNWKQVLHFAEEKFPNDFKRDTWKTTDAQMVRMIRSAWWSGLGSHGVGGNWWSREVRPLWEREKGFRK